MSQMNPKELATILHTRFNYLIVNTNSKYKEDNFTASVAIDYSQDECIYFRPWSNHMSPSLLCSLLTPLHIPAWQSAWNTQDDHNSVSTLTPSRWWFRYWDRCRLCLHLAPQCSRDQHYHLFWTLVMHSNSLIIHSGNVLYVSNES